MVLPALIIIFLLLPVYVTIETKEDEPEVKVKLAFLDITEAALKDEDSDKKDIISVIGGTYKSKYPKKLTLSDKINEFKDELAFARELLRIAAKRLTVKRFRLICRVSTGDAAQTAIIYGSACAAAAALDAFINEYFKVKKQNMYVYPDFTEQRSEIYAFVKLRIFVFSVIGGYISLILSALRRAPRRVRT